MTNPATDESWTPSPNETKGVGSTWTHWSVENETSLDESIGDDMDEKVWSMS